MNIQKLGADVKQQQQVLKTLETNLKEQQAQARDAKAKSRATKIGYKKLRTEAKRAKASLLELKERVEQPRWIFAKAQKRLAKAARKAPEMAKAVKPARKKVVALAGRLAPEVLAARPAQAVPPDGKGTPFESAQRPDASSAISSARPG